MAEFVQFLIDKILPELHSIFIQHNNVVLTAEPGAGKTTRVPVALLEAQWLKSRKIIMLEPRRLAAERAAVFMAEQLGEKVGNTVGYRIRGDKKVSSSTKIEVVTEGILTRMLQDDPACDSIGIIIFDEFHERSIHADLGLALTLDVQHNLREDLRILIMSATLNGSSISELLKNCPVITCEGKSFPVTTHYLSNSTERKIESTIVSTVLRSLKNDSGDLLVFLPGYREIKQIEFLLNQSDLPKNVFIHLLHGDADPNKQRDALTSGSPNYRKIILSTSVAETSLTIDGIGVVIDSGLSRVARFDPSRGMSGLVTVPVSHASADQRRGRAGRQRSGICYRLWTELQHSQLSKYSLPEILNADLAPFALELALWGDPDGKSLNFLDRPPQTHMDQAKLLLQQLGIVDKQTKLTEHGKSVSRLGIHPRMGHMLIKGKEFNLGSLACSVAALLEERDVLKGKENIDLEFSARWKKFKEKHRADEINMKRVLQQSERLRILLNADDNNYSEEKLGALIALAYPERVAKRRSAQSNKFQLAGNTVGSIHKDSFLNQEEYLAVARVDGAGNEVKIQMAQPLKETDIVEIFASEILETEEIFWDDKVDSVVAKRLLRYRALILSEKTFDPPSEKIYSKVIEKICEEGIRFLPWDETAISLRDRSEWIRKSRLVGDSWPNLSDEHLSSNIEIWLGPFLHGIKNKEQILKLPMGKIIQSQFTGQLLKQFDNLAPSHIEVPTGSHIKIDYSSGKNPVLAVRLQEMFGENDTPSLASGKIKLQLHLLSPAHRLLAITQDLKNFWKHVYPEVRKVMRGKYPKHYWPEDPLTAIPTKKTKKQIR